MVFDGLEFNAALRQVDPLDRVLQREAQQSQLDPSRGEDAARTTSSRSGAIASPSAMQNAY